MKKVLLSIGLWIGSISCILGQVGINTIDPKAQLDIVSTNSKAPGITDGILIPRIENFPASSPTADQDGMLVYLTLDQEGFPKGFYYWNDSVKLWKSLIGDTPTIFFQEGTTLAAKNVNEGIYRAGNIGVGAQSPEVKLRVVIDADTDHSVRTGMEVDNASSSPEYVTYGILNNNRSVTNSRKYGIKTNVSAAGKGVHYGIYNEVYQNSVEDIYGIFNKVGRTYGAAKNHYGIYSEIGTPLGAGMVYGIYSKAEGNTPERVYAGYFAGRLAIGTTPPEEYVFPDARGAQHQILVQGNEGSLTWRYPNTKVLTTTSPSTGKYVLQEETHTLVIQDGVSSITIPDASQNIGRIITLLAWNGISTKTLNFVGGDDLWDISAASTVTTISGGQRLTIQSSGNRWLVLSSE